MAKWSRPGLPEALQALGYLGARPSPTTPLPPQPQPPSASAPAASTTHFERAQRPATATSAPSAPLPPLEATEAPTDVYSEDGGMSIEAMEAQLASLLGPQNKGRRKRLRNSIKRLASPSRTAAASPAKAAGNGEKRSRWKRARGGEGGATRAVGGPGASVEPPPRGSASSGAGGSSVLDREVPF